MCEFAELLLETEHDHHCKKIKKEMEALEESQKLFSIKQDNFNEVQDYFKEKSVKE